MENLTLDVFKIDEGGNPIWIESVADLDAAKKIANSFPEHTGFLVFNQLTQSKLFLKDNDITRVESNSSIQII